MRRSDAGDPGSDSGAPVPRTARALSPRPGTALYVHVPYCVAKCTYCDFFSVVDEGADLSGTVEALLTEARARGPAEPRTVFVGGGTPSLLPERELERLFDGLEEACGFRRSASEVTVECNPESLTTAKARALVAAGVDRLSIGFQSLDSVLLELFGRVHSPADSFRAFEAARAADVGAVNVDLIYAVPGQRLPAWEVDLERVLALAPDHVSAYSLAFEEGTALTHDLRRGRLARLDEELELAFFERTRERLGAAGYDAYEISNFALDGHQCLHNIMYWENGDYVGIGPGAVSKLGATRFGSPRSVGAWRAGVEERGFAASWEETLPPLERLGETWWLGLRTARGVDPRAARRTAGVELAGAGDPAVAVAADLGDQGLLRRSRGRWSLTAKGLPLADAVSSRFLGLGSPGSAEEPARTSGKIRDPEAGMHDSPWRD